MSTARIRLTAAARRDVAALLVRSADRFGAAARERYEALIALAFDDLRTEPFRRTSIALSEFGAGLRAYHLKHCRDRARGELGVVRSPRHLLVYRVASPSEVRVIRVLDDRMELRRHIPPAPGATEAD